MDEQLVQGGKVSHPADAEEASWGSRSEGLDERGKVLSGERTSAPLGESGPRARNDQPRPREVVVLAKDQVGNEVTRRPRTEEGRRGGTEFIEQIDELRTFQVVEGGTGHAVEA